MTHLDLFTSALTKCQRYSTEEPGSWLWPSLVEQLSYLVELASGRSSDTTRLAKVCVGAMAAKNIEDRDAELANTLYDVQAAAQQMMNAGR